MRKILFVLTLITGFSSFSQTKSLLICKEVDEFTDEKSITGTENIVIYEDNGDMSSEGMLISQFIKEGKKAAIDLSVLYVKVIGIKGCVDVGSTLDIMFEDGEKTRLTSWKKFNCDGVNYFTLSKKHIGLFKSSKVKALKFTNKRNYDTMVVKANIGKAGSYMMEMLTEVDKINNGELVPSVCKGD